MSTPLPVTGNTAETQPENRAFYPALDGLRAVAFLMVFFHHYSGLPWGWSGVDLFFVLSGFLITGILYDSRNTPNRAKTFYIRRTLRIFPLYYGVLLVLLLASPFMHWAWDWKWIIWPLYLGNFAHLLPQANPAVQDLTNFRLSGEIHGHHSLFLLGHFWSLCVEEQFYLVWPWVVFAVRDRHKLLWICACSLPFCLIARALGAHFMPEAIAPSIVSHLTPFRADTLLTGGLLALLLRGPAKNVVLKTARLSLPIVTAIVILWLVLIPGERIAWMSDGRIEIIGLTLTCLFSAVLIACAIQPGLWLSQVLSIRPLRWAGRISYGTYVFHDIFHLTYDHLAEVLHLHSAYGPALVGLACTYLLAWLSFHFFETPFLKLKNRWTLATSSAEPNSSLS